MGRTTRFLACAALVTGLLFTPAAATAQHRHHRHHRHGVHLVLDFGGDHRGFDRFYRSPYPGYPYYADPDHDYMYRSPYRPYHRYHPYPYVRSYYGWPGHRHVSHHRRHNRHGHGW